MAKALFVDNWKKHQHYKDRNPPWIKLATNTFQSYEFSRLQDASKLLAICIWTLASRSEDGSVPHDFGYIKSQCCLGEMVQECHLQELINERFLIDRDTASNPLAERKQTACPETETETETEKRRDISPAREVHYEPEPPANSDFMVEMLCSEHPKNAKPGPAHREAHAAIIRESTKLGGAQQAYEFLLHRVKVYKKLTDEWPEKEKKFMVTAETFFRDKVYLADEKLWVKGASYSDEQMAHAAGLI